MKFLRLVPFLFMALYSCVAQNGPTQPSVTISFTQSTTPGVTANCLYRSTTSTPVLPGTCSKVPVTSLTDDTAVAGTNYNYWVTAQVLGAESAYSSPLAVSVPTNPNAPTNLAPQSITKNSPLIGSQVGDLTARVDWIKRP